MQTLYKQLDIKNIQENKPFLNNLLINGFLSYNYNFLYVAVPKVACTTMKWWFAKLEAVDLDVSSIHKSLESTPELVIHDIANIAPHLTRLPLSVIEEYLSKKDAFCFTLVRNPYMRIFSAWQSKMLLQEPLRIIPYQKYDFCNYKIDNKKDISLAFEYFLEHLYAYEHPANFLDPHFMPQYKILRPDIFPYSLIVKLEEKEKLKEALKIHLGEDVALPFEDKGNNVSLLSYNTEFITARSVELIKTIYQKDFEIFNYSTELPVSKKNISEQEISIAIQAINMIRWRHQRISEMRSVSNNTINNLKNENATLQKLNTQQLIKVENTLSALQKTIENIAQHLINFPSTPQRFFLFFYTPILKLIAKPKYYQQFKDNPNNFFADTESTMNKIFLKFLELFGPKAKRF
ncbi:sulfotransferase family 2 domain-containing protein [Desulfovibrio litoralis]|uniref:Sulfotransferase family protein n=1 Tax=Desulfovibrio litoralis DSM 11393 TaxID=1121455 RepID=A0A1M7RS05_9BACT|nr:sulfotransferase family 2 domain-containing protein [Desulfovibrio litoralis]SHN49039.1 Sulfotransferase family protein [Desulfovibrio litoralis DSM 11393]